MRITSRDNSLLREARAVRDGKVDHLIFVEGLRLCEEALQSGLRIQAVISSEEIAEKERASRFLEEVGPVAGRLAVVSEKLLATISYTKTPQGIILLADRPQQGSLKLEASGDRTPLLVILHGINNPVNVGAILRSAEAAGATGAISTAQTADPYSPKALRGAMGSAFRLPLWHGPSYAEAMAWCQARGIKTLCADVEATTTHTAIDWTLPTALILGQESTGLTPEEIALARDVVKIDMHGSVESLNVSVAAAVMLFEAARQRGIISRQ
ncbi:MAG TPA: RNA methyltransferase [Pyrinomonadaceae bacterium]|nr:RNA methyltransferase [Pyrinomonadaceae bacterium]